MNPAATPATAGSAAVAHAAPPPAPASAPAPPLPPSFPDPVALAFERARDDFKDKLKDCPGIYDAVCRTKTIDEVYDLTDELQRGERGQQLRNLRKLDKFLAPLRDYDETVTTFVQVKPDVLALIWGPAKLLLQWSSSFAKSFDALLAAAADVGQALPRFLEFARLFDSPRLLEVLVLFFEDLLDFYVISLKFFRDDSKLKHFFHALWPNRQEKIQAVVGNIRRHGELMRIEVQYEHIREARLARDKVLAEFESVKASLQRQEFEAMSARLAPVSYDSSLNRFRGQLCKGTDKWLLEDKTFKKWLDVKDQSTKVFWLNGIPGAGKTYLVVSAMATVQLLGRVVFGFLSHSQIRDAKTALAILHSLIFQLARPSQSLQEVMVLSSKANLENDVAVAKGLLETLLNCAGPTFIIVDGLDEISEVERQRLLAALLDLSSVCQEAKLMVASRSESDIGAALDKNCMEARVDQSNADAIGLFVGDRAEQLLRESPFNNQEKAEIRVLLQPLAAKCEGMILYAKIVLSNVEHLGPDELRDELKVLPESLDVAYKRIMERIASHLPPAAKEKAQKVIGWVGCSPIPISVLELEQAVVISSGRFNPSGTVSSSLDVARLCGPLVEVVDGYVHLSHFTVKDYIFRASPGGLLDIGDASLSLATCCVEYFLQDHYDSDLSTADIENYVRGGAYRLDCFATAVWHSLVKRCPPVQEPAQEPMQGGDLCSALLARLDDLLQKRHNKKVDGQEIEKSNATPSQKTKQSRPGYHAVVSRTAAFMANPQAPSYHINKEFDDSYPLSTCHTSRILHEVVSDLGIEDLQKHYGPKPFKCGFLECRYRRHEFESAELRDNHEKQHEVPWKCDDITCEYSNIGFLSARMKERHCQTSHRNSSSSTASSQTLVRVGESSSELKVLLLDLIRTDQVDAVKSLLAQPRFVELCDTGTNQDDFLNCAARHGSPDMMDAIVDSSSFPTLRRGLGGEAVVWGFWLWRAGHCVKHNNFGTFRWYADNFNKSIKPETSMLTKQLRRCYGDWGSLFKLVLLSESNAIFELWMDSFLSHYSWSNSFRNKDLGLYDGGRGRGLVQCAQGNPEREARLISFWERLSHGPCDKTELQSWFARWLGWIARSTFSIKLARSLLELGMAVDEQQPGYGLGFTALRVALLTDSREAAELVRFLLDWGADPTWGDEKLGPMHNMAGAGGISKWLGQPFNQVVLEAQERRHQKRGQSGLVGPRRLREWE